MNQNQFQSLAGPKLIHEAIWIQAPGRINLIGEHTDYNHGFVFPASIDKKMYFGITHNGESGENWIWAYNLDKEATFKSGDYNPEGSGWEKYLQALIQIWIEKGYPSPSVRLAFGGDIPLGAGLSSSAAMGTGFIYGLSKLMGIEIDRWDIVKIAQAAEHKIGANVGIMDQFAVLFGKESHAMKLDCRDHTFDYFPVNLPNHQLVLINTKVSHSLAESAYNDRRAATERVLAFLKDQNPKIETLRDISLDGLQAYRDQINPLDFMRVENVLEENSRVQQAAEALASNDLKSFGSLLYQSHEGLSKKYEVSCEELDILVDLAKKEEAVLGSRMMGGGFGGCTINLIEKNAAEEVAKRIMDSYKDITHLEPEVYFVSIEDGVKEIS
ncbi:MAG: galactokinase [Bacteroidia bacterium]|nr:galactokinase [Bacteroidia bacterium]